MIHRLIIVLILAPMLMGQTVGGNAQLNGTIGVGNSPTGIPRLPFAWVNSHVCDPPGGTYDVTKTIPGSYAATWAGINQAMTDWVAAPDQWWHVVITHGTLITGNSGLTLLAKAVGAGKPTKCLVFESDTPLTSGQTVCAHGIQDNLPQSTDPGIRNPDCNGNNMGYQLGQTLTSIPTGAFTLANGTATNTSNYNDVASMYTLETTTTNGNVVVAGGSDVNGNGPNHIVMRDMEARIVNTLVCCDPVTIDNSSSTLAGLPSVIGFDRVWIHGDATDAGVGNNALPDDIRMNCINCWFMNSQTSKSIRPGSEGHGVLFFVTNQLKVVHNWIEGESIGIFSGGTGNAVITGVSGNDIEIRRNRITYPLPWLGHGQGGGVCGTQSCVRKNATEFKGCIRCLLDGNIFENSDGSGGQSGRILAYNNRACSPGPCDNYIQTTSEITTTNDIVRHGCRGMEFDPNSDNVGSGASATTPGRDALWSNVLVYDVSLTNPGCQAAGVSTGFGFNAGDSAHSFTINSVSRDSTGTYVTVVLAGGTGEKQTGLVAGDPVALTGCTDTTFNTTLNPFVTVLSANGPVVTFLNSGTANASTTCTSFNNGNGWPNLLKLQHVTIVADTTMQSIASSLGVAQVARSRGQTYIDSIFSGSGGWASPGNNDGTNFENTWLDNTTLIAHHDVIAMRNAPAWTASTAYNLGALVKPATGSPSHEYMAVTSGTSGTVNTVFNGSGTSYACVTDGTVVWQNVGLLLPTFSSAPDYTEYDTQGTGVRPPTTLFFPTFAYGYNGLTTNAIGFSGALNQPTSGTNTCTSGTAVSGVDSSLDLSDWHGYQLAPQSSFHNAASDGTDMGVNVTNLDAAQTRTKYVCSYYCGGGPFSD